MLTTIDLAPRIGTEIKADVETLLDGSAAGEIRATLEDRGVIAFREINLSDAQQLTFATTLGTIVEQGPGNIYKIITMDTRENPNAEYLKGAFYWHIDGTMSEVPILASMLSGRRLSATDGHTEFSTTHAAYDDLPAAEKDEIENLRVVHSLEAAQRYTDPEPSLAALRAWQKVGTNTLPLVWKHRSGRMLRRTKLHGEVPFA